MQDSHGLLDIGLVGLDLGRGRSGIGLGGVQVRNGYKFVFRQRALPLELPVGELGQHPILVQGGLGLGIVGAGIFQRGLEQPGINLRDDLPLLHGRVEIGVEPQN